MDDDIVVTNRDVAKLIAENNGGRFELKAGMDGLPLAASLNSAHEYDDAPAGAERVFKITEVLYMERDSGPNDIAFLRVIRKPSGLSPRFVPVAATDVGPDVAVCVIEYPARAPRSVIPDQELMRALYPPPERQIPIPSSGFLSVPGAGVAIVQSSGSVGSLIVVVPPVGRTLRRT